MEGLWNYSDFKKEIKVGYALIMVNTCLTLCLYVNWVF